jgi:hypothetical protein
MLGRASAYRIVLTLWIRFGRDRKLLRDPKVTHDKFVNFQSSDPGPTDGQPSNGDRTNGYGAKRNGAQCHGTNSLRTGRNRRKGTRTKNTLALHKDHDHFAELRAGVSTVRHKGAA